MNRDAISFFYFLFLLEILVLFSFFPYTSLLTAIDSKDRDSFPANIEARKERKKIYMYISEQINMQ